ncbi:MAG: membrane dipeptidase, partial [Gemmatimonadaceae bacterium]
MKQRSRVLLVLGVILVLSLLPIAFTVPQFIDSDTNTLIPDRLITVSAQAKALHATLWVVDLHNDLLLWNRDPLLEHVRGHTDVPRLLEGRTAVQVFSAVTKSPRGLNYESNTGDSDNITLLAVLQRWPPKTWGSRTQRALHQARRLHDAARRSNGALSVITSAADLDAFLA